MFQKISNKKTSITICFLKYPERQKSKLTHTSLDTEQERQFIEEKNQEWTQGHFPA